MVSARVEALLLQIFLATNPIEKAEFDSTSLNSVSNASGFNCYLQKKFYSVLSSRNQESSNVQHFDEVHVEFLPGMLRSIQKYSEYHIGDNSPPKRDEDIEALSVVYEIMQNWDKAFST